MQIYYWKWQTLDNFDNLSVEDKMNEKEEALIGEFFIIIEWVRDKYPEDIFPDNETITGKSAKMARLTCDNIKRELRRYLYDEIY